MVLPADKIWSLERADFSPLYEASLIKETFLWVFPIKHTRHKGGLDMRERAPSAVDFH